MSVIITKQGMEENSFTWEYYCDTYEDLNSIEQENITIGSYCTLLQGENGVEIYAGDGNHQWILVTPNVRDEYAAEHDGKVILNGNLFSQSNRTINENGTYDTTLNNEINVLVKPSLQNKTVTSNGIITHDENYYGLNYVTVNVPNSYKNEDEGKVVQNGDLVNQTSKVIAKNGIYDTTINNKVIVDTENIFEGSDEGKVVREGTLVPQSARYSKIIANGTYDTTNNNSVEVKIPGGPRLAVPHILWWYTNLMREVSGGMTGDNVSISIGEVQVTAKKLIVLTMINVSNHSTALREPDVEVDSVELEPVYSKYHVDRNDDDGRHYRFDVYDLPSLSTGTIVSIGFTTFYRYTSFVCAFVSDDFDVGKIMTNRNAATTGSDSEDGCVLYGTFNGEDENDVTITGLDYTKNSIITTTDPGGGYGGDRSSFIIWLRQKYYFVMDT